VNSPSKRQITKGGSMLAKPTGPVDSQKRLLRVIGDFLKVHDTLDSKYWPMLEQFLQRLEKEIPVKRITKEFHLAYRQVKKTDNVPAYWYRIINDIQCVALKGRPWVKKHKAKKFGFWKLLTLASLTEPKEWSGSKSDQRAAVRNKHFRYFLKEAPAEFPFLFSCFVEEKRLPNFSAKEIHKDKKAYERMAIRLLTI